MVNGSIATAVLLGQLIGICPYSGSLVLRVTTKYLSKIFGLQSARKGCFTGKVADALGVNKLDTDVLD